MASSAKGGYASIIRAAASIANRTGSIRISIAIAIFILIAIEESRDPMQMAILAIARNALYLAVRRSMRSVLHVGP
jgi:hypothetical protein